MGVCKQLHNCSSRNLLNYLIVKDKLRVENKTLKHNLWRYIYETRHKDIMTVDWISSSNQQLPKMEKNRAWEVQINLHM